MRSWIVDRLDEVLMKEQELLKYAYTPIMYFSIFYRIVYVDDSV